MTDTLNTDPLSTIDHWDKTWAASGDQTITFDPSQPFFRDLHKLLKDNLPAGASNKFLEIGSYPGTYMWYFHKFFGYKVSGLEYVEWCCEAARKLLRKEGVDAEVIHGDLFKYAPEDNEQLWDVVGSFGFIEHFTDTAPVIERHLSLLKPGGLMVLVVPNHTGIYGRLLKSSDREAYETHNRMSLQDMTAATLKSDNVEVLAAGYYGRIGFWASGIYAKYSQRSRLVYTAIRAPLWVLERLGRFLPNSKAFSPNAALIARKLPD